MCRGCIQHVVDAGAAQHLSAQRTRACSCAARAAAATTTNPACGRDRQTQSPTGGPPTRARTPRSDRDGRGECQRRTPPGLAFRHCAAIRHRRAYAKPLLYGWKRVSTTKLGVSYTPTAVRVSADVAIDKFTARSAVISLLPFPLRYAKINRILLHKVPFVTSSHKATPPAVAGTGGMDDKFTKRAAPLQFNAERGSAHVDRGTTAIGSGASTRTTSL